MRSAGEGRARGAQHASYQTQRGTSGYAKAHVIALQEREAKALSKLGVAQAPSAGAVEDPFDKILRRRAKRMAAREVTS